MRLSIEGQKEECYDNKQKKKKNSSVISSKT